MISFDLVREGLGGGGWRGGGGREEVEGVRMRKRESIKNFFGIAGTNKYFDYSVGFECAVLLLEVRFKDSPTS